MFKKMLEYCINNAKEVITYCLILIWVLAMVYGIGFYSRKQKIIRPVIKKEQIIKPVVKPIIKPIIKEKSKTKDFLLYLNSELDPKVAKIIADSINESSLKYHLPKKLICAIIYKESRINPFAKSSVGAIGLMQVMPKIHKDKVDEKNLWHIDNNIDIGCSIFKEYYDLEKGDLNKTFHRYLSKNASKKEVKKYYGDIYENWSKLEMFEYNKEK